MEEASTVEVVGSVEFDEAGRDLLSDALGVPVAVRKGKPAPAPAVPADEVVDGSPAPWQQHFIGIDPASILVLLLSPIPGMVYEELATRLGGHFWGRLKQLLHLSSKQNPGTALSSLQVQLPPRLVRGVDVEVTVTALDAEYVPDEDWTLALESGLNEVDDVIERTVSAALAASSEAGYRVRVYGLVEGGGELSWRSEVVAL